MKRLINAHLMLISFVMLIGLILPHVAVAAGQQIVNLERGWFYHSGLVDPAASNQVQWRAVDRLTSIPQSSKVVTEVVTLRTTIPPYSCTDCVLYFDSLYHDYRVFLNGALFASSGNAADLSTHTKVGNPAEWFPLTSQVAGQELLIQVRSESGSTGVYGRVLLANASDLNLLLFEENWLDVALCVFVLSIGLLVITVFFPQRGEAVYLFFGLTAFNLGIYMISRIELLKLWFPSPYAFDQFEYFGCYAFGLTFWLYIRSIFLVNSRWPWYVIGLQFVMLLAVLIAWAGFGIPPYRWITLVQLQLIVSLVGLVVVSAVFAWRGNREARFVFFSIGFVMLMGVSEVVMSLFSLNTKLVLGKFAVPLFVFAQLIMLAQRWTQMNKELKEMNTELERWNTDLESRVADRTQKVRSLLDNVSEGFLTVNPQRIVDDEHSAACEGILGMKPAGKTIEQVLWTGNPSEQALVAELIDEIFRSKFSKDWEIYLSLMPREIQLNGRILELSCRPITVPGGGGLAKLLLVVNDLTEKRLLQEQAESEEQLLRMIISVLSKPHDYQDLMNDYRLFSLVELPALLDDPAVDEETVSIVMRMIHTFKGNFAQFGSKSFASVLHWFEQSLVREPNENVHEWLQRAVDLPWSDALNEELVTMQAIIPMPWLTSNKDTVTVDREILHQLKQYILDNLPKDMALPLASQLERLVQQPFRAMFESLNGYAQQLSDRLGKLIQPIEISGGDFEVDPDDWRSWLKALVHVVRNQMDHGIETVDDRLEAGKEESGHLRISILRQSEEVRIVFEDDGAGIDQVKLRDKLVEKGFVHQEMADLMAAEELYPYLFLDQFSTRDHVTELSGRGVGLAKVLEETEKLGGRIEMKSDLGKGTAMTFVFPLAS